MHLNIKHFVSFVTIAVLLVGCSEKTQKIKEIKSEIIIISDSISTNDSINEFIKPFKSHINTVLDTPLAYATMDFTKHDGVLNTTEGNLIADLLMSQANPIFFNRTGKSIDLVLLNHGGLRSLISKGSVSRRTAYEVMPFENAIVVVELDGKAIKEMITYLINDSRQHPFSGMEIVIDKNDKLVSLEIQKLAFKENKNYYVATSDYLLSGGDHMNFFKKPISVTNLDYSIRNAIIDYFVKVDSIKASLDNRFIKID